MKLITSALLGAVSAAALVAASSTGFAMDEITPQEKALIDAAKKEGEVTLINPIFQEITADNFQKAFRKRYGLGDSFKFNNLRKGTGATIAQVQQEIKAGKFTVDAHIVNAPGFFDEAAKRGAFLELDSGQWKNHEALVKKAGQYSNYPYVVTPLAYSFQPIWNAGCPGMENFTVTSYADVLDPALKGKTIASDLTKSATYTNTVIALSKAGALDLEDTWKKLKAQEPAIEFRTEAKRQMVVSCERPVDMWNITGRVLQAEQADPSLKGKLKFGVYKEGQVMLGNQLAVLKGAPHPNAGKLLVEFMMTTEGADAYVADEVLFTFREGYTPPEVARPYMFDLATTKLVGMEDWVGAARDFKPVREKWQSYFQ
jgi:ABC-type Fe3+ transport system substrate-binding protein